MQEKDAIKSTLAALDFEYSDPHRGFDRSTVKGLVASLVTLDDAHVDAATALEVCAGGRLYNVVVDDENVGSSILAKGNLRKRVTIIPLNKISANPASKATINTVKKVSPKTDLALSLVGYDDEVSKAMEYVFGNTLICPDAVSANLVTFHKEIRMRSVTLQGDVYDTSGSLSGGSSPSGGGVLVKVQKLKRVEAELAKHKSALAAVEREWEQAKDAMNRFKQAQKALELKTHEVGLLEERVQESNATRVSSGDSCYSEMRKLTRYCRSSPRLRRSRRASQSSLRRSPNPSRSRRTLSPSANASKRRWTSSRTTVVPSWSRSRCVSGRLCEA